MAERTVNKGGGLGRFSRLTFDLIKLCLDGNPLGIDLRDAVEQLLATLPELGNIFHGLVKTCSQLGSELLTTLHRIAQLPFQLHRLNTAVCAGDAAIQLALNVIDKAHDSPSMLKRGGDDSRSVTLCANYTMRQLTGAERAL